MRVKKNNFEFRACFSQLQRSTPGAVEVASLGDRAIIRNELTTHVVQDVEEGQTRHFAASMNLTTVTPLCQATLNISGTYAENHSKRHEQKQR